MDEIEKQILDEYATACSIGELSYKIMGRMLDEAFVGERLRLFGVKEAYLYAGSYMAVQLYRVAQKHTCIKGIVDKNRKLPVRENVPVLTLDELRMQYHGETVIITSLRHGAEIKRELEVFADESRVLSIGELLFGLV